MTPQRKAGDVVNGSDLRCFGSILQIITLPRKSCMSFLLRWHPNVSELFYNRFLKVPLYAIFSMRNILWNITRKEICLRIDRMSLVIIHMVKWTNVIISYQLTHQLRYYWNVRYRVWPIESSFLLSFLWYRGAVATFATEGQYHRYFSRQRAYIW